MDNVNKEFLKNIINKFKEYIRIFREVSNEKTEAFKVSFKENNKSLLLFREFIII